MAKRNVNKGQQRSIRAIEGTKSRKGNGYLRSQTKKSKLWARLEICHVCHGELMFIGTRKRNGCRNGTPALPCGTGNGFPIGRSETPMT